MQRQWSENHLSNVKSECRTLQLLKTHALNGWKCRLNVTERRENGEVYHSKRLQTRLTGDGFDKSNCHEETSTLTSTQSDSESSEIITWRFRGFDCWMFSPLLQGALLNEKLKKKIKRAFLDTSDIGTSEKAAAKLTWVFNYSLVENCFVSGVSSLYYVSNIP